MKVFSPLNTIVVINGVEISGWADGDDVIDIKRLSKSATHKIGMMGDMFVSLSADRSAQCDLKLSALSSSNAYLESLVSQQENGADTFTPVTILFQDTYRQDRAAASAGYLEKPADMKRGTTAGDQTWTIIVEKLSLDYGSN